LYNQYGTIAMTASNEVQFKVNQLDILCKVDIN